MAEEIYTLGWWRVKEGSQEEFVAAWAALGRYFRELPDPPGQGTLVQSIDDPQEYYSFGSWPSLEAVGAMRSRPDAAGEIAKLLELCDEGRPGTYRVVATA